MNCILENSYEVQGFRYNTVYIAEIQLELNYWGSPLHLKDMMEMRNDSGYVSLNATTLGGNETTNLAKTILSIIATPLSLIRNTLVISSVYSVNNAK